MNKISTPGSVDIHLWTQETDVEPQALAQLNSFHENSIIGKKYRYWRSDSKNCEPEIVLVEAWPYEPAPGCVLLCLPEGHHEAIHVDEFFKKRHQRVDDKTTAGEHCSLLRTLE